MIGPSNVAENVTLSPTFTVASSGLLATVAATAGGENAPVVSYRMYSSSTVVIGMLEQQSPTMNRLWVVVAWAAAPSVSNAPLRQT